MHGHVKDHIFQVGAGSNDDDGTRKKDMIFNMLVHLFSVNLVITIVLSAINNEVCNI